MTKYRIKKITYENDRVVYYPQYYIGFFSGWGGITCLGEKLEHFDEGTFCYGIEGALEIIDLCHSIKKNKVRIQTIEFEYVDK